ncbi:MAG: tRNA 2-thiouridine(34) synthase MnmA [Gammaproteobacteria bacterium]|nr:tRNA 2-thiouridine(34) synthase MnmA [Gammaproteobacteria bacterium]MBL7000010.1 tRNA 2-thiouridine(34) synthase MnmA [Gammaproteobacteria bacterium]
MSKEKIIIGISGGVDSAVAALLLKQQGYEVEALFMKNWEEDDTAEYCSATVDLADAQQVCDRLDIPLHSVNFATEYWDRVFEYFLEEYRKGRTPNPDIMCNKEIKFKAFLEYARSLGASRIATGHYVQNRTLEGRTELLRGLDENKDQSYFLYALSSYQLSTALFPVGRLEKPEVRQLAQAQGFDVFNKKDSTGICFIGERKFKDFLQQFIPAQPGSIQTLEGNTIGSHSGLMYYTIGQRQGLGIGGLQNASEQPWFVVAKDLQSNILVVTQGHDHPALFHTHCEIQGLHWINPQNIQLPFSCSAKIRYRQQDQACTISAIHNATATVQFSKPQRAITAGQSLVFYAQEVCLGGGIIDKAYNLK